MNYEQAKQIARVFGVHVSCSEDMFVYYADGFIASPDAFGPTCAQRKNIGYYGLSSAMVANYFVLGRIKWPNRAVTVYFNEEPTPEEKASFWSVKPKDLPRADGFFEWLKERELNPSRQDSVAVELKRIWDDNGGGYAAK